jgi:HK97 family phage prohead protease
MSGEIDARTFLQQEIRAELLERRLRRLGFRVREGALAPPRPLTFAAPAAVLTRSFDSAEISAQGRRVEIFCAPFNAPARVVDPPPAGDGKPYLEELLPGCFREATLDPLAVELDISHGERTVGHAERLEEKPVGLVGTFTLTGSRREVDRTTSLIRCGHLGGASVAFSSIESRRSPAGVVQRVRVDLSRVALCRAAAYEGARVLATRSAV